LLDALARVALAKFLNRLNTASASVLMLDYDGTLAPFHIDRARAYPYPEVVPILEKIVQCGKSRVVLVTGRPAVEIKALLSPLDHFEIWGSHGLEYVSRDGSYRRVAIDSHTAALLSQAEAWLSETDLAPMAEIKPGGIAIHWRGMPDAEIEKIQARTREGWSALAQQPELKLLEFEAGLELRVASPDKGDAIASILGDSNADTPIAYLGDDLTDEDAFCTLSDRGLTVLVRTEYRETRARVWLRPPHELIEFLEQWLTRIST